MKSVLGLKTNISEKTKIYVPMAGNYQFFARVLKGPQYGDLHLLVDNEVLNASCYEESLNFDWLNLGSVYLSQGEHEIGIGATGNVKPDLIAIASIKEGKQFSSINELFPQKLRILSSALKE